MPTNTPLSADAARAILYADNAGDGDTHLGDSLKRLGRFLASMVIMSVDDSPDRHRWAAWCEQKAELIERIAGELAETGWEELLDFYTQQFRRSVANLQNANQVADEWRTLARTLQAAAAQILAPGMVKLTMTLQAENPANASLLAELVRDYLDNRFAHDLFDHQDAWIGRQAGDGEARMEALAFDWQVKDVTVVPG